VCRHSAAASILRRLREDGGALSADAIPDVETARLALNVCRQQLGWLDYLIREVSSSVRFYLSRSEWNVKSAPRRSETHLMLTVNISDAHTSIAGPG
jgi:hypothetical protein